MNVAYWLVPLVLLSHDFGNPLLLLESWEEQP